MEFTSITALHIVALATPFYFATYEHLPFSVALHNVSSSKTIGAQYENNRNNKTHVTYTENNACDNFHPHWNWLHKWHGKLMYYLSHVCFCMYIYKRTCCPCDGNLISETLFWETHFWLIKEILGIELFRYLLIMNPICWVSWLASTRLTLRLFCGIVQNFVDHISQLNCSGMNRVADWGW